ncbi:DUF1446 domain-containing protein [Agathobaculum sp. TL06]
MKKYVRIGGGSAGAEDRIDAALDLIEKGNIDYICFDSLSESELSLIAAHQEANPGAKGYDVFLEMKMMQILKPCADNGVKIVGNMGGTDPVAGAELIVECAKKLGIKKLKVAACVGDNVVELCKDLDLYTVEGNKRIRDFGDKLVTANAYVSADHITEALDNGADVVITGRVGDAAMFLGPLRHEFGWKNDEWDKLSAGICVGHLLECGAQSTGGFYADPPYRVVPDLDTMGYPIAEVYPDGSFKITKPEGTGGMVTPQTCTAQMLYETHDPRHYIEADVITDFADMHFEQESKDVVKQTGVIKGMPKPELLKVSMGVREGWLGSTIVFYAGPGAAERGKLAQDILNKRLARVLKSPEAEYQVVVTGLDGIYLDAPGVPKNLEPWEVGVRTAVRSPLYEDAMTGAREGSTTLITSGPASPAGKQRQYEMKEIVGYYHTFIPREKVSISIEYREV